jgi:hypothetical protein
MKSILFKQSVLLSCFAASAVLVSGCSQQATETENSSAPVADASDADPSHGGWWCVEHGIPEEQCSMCSSKAADAFKAKEDWCEDHKRAESQCFICEPSRAEKFAKLYEAKVGREPPPLDEADLLAQ